MEVVFSSGVNKDPDGGPLDLSPGRLLRRDGQLFEVACLDKTPFSRDNCESFGLTLKRLQPGPCEGITELKEGVTIRTQGANYTLHKIEYTPLANNYYEIIILLLRYEGRDLGEALADLADSQKGGR